MPELNLDTQQPPEIPEIRRLELTSYLVGLRDIVGSASEKLNTLPSIIAEIGSKDNLTEEISTLIQNLRDVESIIKQVEIALDERSAKLLKASDKHATYTRQILRDELHEKVVKIADRLNAKVLALGARLEHKIDGEIDQIKTSFKNFEAQVIADIEADREQQREMRRQMMDSNKFLMALVNEQDRKINALEMKMEALEKDNETLLEVVAVRLDEIKREALELPSSSDVQQFADNILDRNEEANRTLKTELAALQTELASVRKSDDERVKGYVDVATAVAMKTMKKEFGELEEKIGEYEDRLKTLTLYIKQVSEAKSEKKWGLFAKKPDLEGILGVMSDIIAGKVKKR